METKLHCPSSKSRKVFRVGIAYVVSVWLLLLVANVVLNNFEVDGLMVDHSPFLLFLTSRKKFLISLVPGHSWEGIL
jgi:hypothetical protein